MSKLTKLLKTPKLFFYDLALNKGLTKRKSVKDYFNEITTFAQYYDVNSMKIGSEYIWPYIRNHMWVNLNYISIGKNHRRSLNSIGLQNGHPSQLPLSFRNMVKYKYNAQEIDEIETKKVDFLFFTQVGATEQVTINSKIYCRITDPLYEVAKTIGIAEKIEIIKSQNAKEIEKWDRYVHKSRLVLPPLIQTYGYTYKLTMNATFFHRWKQCVPSLILSNKRQLNAIIDYEMHTRSFYINLLKKIQPKVIILHGFHYHGPLISAADSLGITTVDLQHGLQVGWNPLYNNYDEVPSCGYQSLPDFFAVWGKKEYNNISNTFNSAKHRPIIMGNPWLDKIESLISENLSNEIIDKISKYKIKILIIMQNQTKVPDLFLDLIKQSGTDVLWIVRHHPKGEKYTKEDFSSKDNVLINSEVDNILINILFKYIDITISEGSALAIEADYFGIHNIIVGKEGYENYKEEIKNKKFYFLKEVSEFKNILNMIREKNNSVINNIGGIQRVDIVNFLITLKQYRKTKSIAVHAKEFMDPYIEELTHLTQQMYLKVKRSNIDDAILLFFELRKKLEKTPNLDKIYYDETSLWEKEAKIFKRHIQNAQNNLGIHKIILISDSLHLPRPTSIKNIEYKIENTTSYVFNNLEPNMLQIIPWAQRYLTTDKLISNWSTIMKGLEGNHLIIHLGINDCAERMFLEKQRLALNVYPSKIKNEIIDFSKKYRNEIIKNQNNHAYVKHNYFVHNIDTICKMAMDAKVRSLTFINIISFPTSYDKSTEKTQYYVKKYNKSIEHLSDKFSNLNIRIIDLNTSIHKNFTKYMDKDMIHLNNHGHVLLANLILQNFKGLI